MSQLNSLLESAGSGWKNMQSDAARLANKWEKTGLLEGLGSEVNKNNMSLIWKTSSNLYLRLQNRVSYGSKLILLYIELTSLLGLLNLSFPRILRFP